MNQRDYNLQIRTASPGDRPGVIELIDRVYREYGDRVCLEGAESDLLEIPEHYHRLHGDFWVLSDSEGGIYGSHAAHAIDRQQGTCGFRRLYLAEELRGLGFGHQLMQWTIDWAWQAGYRRVEFWSDTRFERAHRFFESFGFERDGRVRTLHDGHQPYQEFFFSLDRPANSSGPATVE